MDIDHFEWMAVAIGEATKAAEKAEVPIGAVMIDSGGNILTQAHNQTITLNDPTAHAEVLAIREAARKVGNYRLLNTSLYVTVEPCVMCMGAIVHARVARVVFGAPDPKWGACGSIYDFAGDKYLNHQPELVGGIREDECRELMQAFFRLRRQQLESDRMKGNL